MIRSKPRAVKIIPQVFFSAKENGLPQSPFRLYFMAKAFDQGTGHVPKDSFKDFMKGMGISNTSFYRDLGETLEWGLICESKNENGDKVLHLAKWETVVEVAGVSKWIECWVLIPIEQLSCKGWISIVWASYLKNFEGRLISRQTLEEKTGVPRRTQINREGQAGVKNFSNYANFGKPEDNPELTMRLHGQPGIYYKHGFVRTRLPNRRVVSEKIKLANKGRLRNIRRASNIMVGSQGQYEKLYCDDYAELRNAQRKERKNNIAAKERKDVVFLKTADVAGRGVYEAIKKT